jgi:ABC-2 type transport system permease protein
MNKILYIIWKDIKLRFSSPMEWLFFLILPIFFTLVLAGGTGAAADQRVRLVTVDLAHSPLSAEVIKALEQSDAVRVEVMALAPAEQQFAERDAPVLLLIPADFDLARLKQGQAQLELRQLPNNTAALAAVQAVRAVINRMSSAFEIASAAVDEAGRIQPITAESEREAYFDAALRAAQAGLIQAPAGLVVRRGAVQDTIDFNPRASSSAGQLITWVFIPLLGIASTFAYERQKGTLRRLMTTPTRKTTFLLGTIAGNVLVALLQMTLLIGFGSLVLHLNWGHSPLALVLIMFASALAAAALGTTLGTFVKSEGQANGLSILLGQLMALLGGCWYPIELFPSFVQNAVKILPTRWAMQGMLNLVQRGQGIEGVLSESAVLLGFALIFFTIGVLRFGYDG